MTKASVRDYSMQDLLNKTAELPLLVIWLFCLRKGGLK
jgi:hypothetical protein